MIWIEFIGGLCIKWHGVTNISVVTGGMTAWQAGRRILRKVPHL
jgi:3-mercaptopyruvate sulfurtransferase SseA